MSRHPAIACAAVPTLRPSCPRSVRILVLAVLLTLALGFRLHAAGSVADLDRDNGLPDAQLGAPLSSFQGLQKTEDVGRWLTFKRPADALRYGKHELTGITYNFFKDRLYSINLDVQGKGNVKGIVKMLEQNYGKEHTTDTLPFAKINLTMDVREWTGSRVYCVFKSASDNTGGVLTLLDKPTWDLLQIPKKEKLEANKQMLGGSYMNGDLDRKPESTPPPKPQAPEPEPAPPNPADAAPAPFSLKPPQ